MFEYKQMLPTVSFVLELKVVAILTLFCEKLLEVITNSISSDSNDWINQKSLNWNSFGSSYTAFYAYTVGQNFLLKEFFFYWDTQKVF